MSDIEEDEIVVHSLREAKTIFGVSPDTIRQWCLSGRLEGSQDAGTPGKPGKWTITIPKTHPDLPQNRVEHPPHYYPRVEDARDIELAGLRAENERLRSEVDFLREQVLIGQRQLPELAERLLSQLKPLALSAPNTRPWWRHLWPWS